MVGRFRGERVRPRGQYGWEGPFSYAIRGSGAELRQSIEHRNRRVGRGGPGDGGGGQPGNNGPRRGQRIQRDVQRGGGGRDIAERVGLRGGDGVDAFGQWRSGGDEPVAAAADRAGPDRGR